MSDKKVKASLELDVSSVESGAKKAKNHIKDVNNEFDKLGDKGQQGTSKAGKGVSDLTKGLESLQKTGKTLTTTLTLPILGFGALATKEASQFNYSMAEVSAISGATGEDLAKLEKQARELGKTTFFSAQEASQGMKYYAMAGFEVSEIMSAMPATLDLATASNTDLARTCDIVSDAMQALKIPIADTSKFTDILAMASSKANTNVEMLGESFKYCAPIAGELGIKAEDLAVGLGLMANAGIKSSMSGTQMRTALARLVKPTSEMQKTMDKYNIALQTNEDGTVDLMGTMKHLRSVLGDLEETERANVLATLMGQESMAGWSAIVGASEEDFNKLTEAIYDSEGATKKMADTMANTFEGKLKSLNSAFGELKIAVGNVLIPILEKLVDKITDAFNWFNNLDEGAQKIIVGAGGMVAAIGPVLLIIGNLGKAVIGVSKVLSPLAKGLGLAGGAAGALTAGIGIAITALTAFISYVGASNDMLSSLQRNFGFAGEMIGTTCEMIHGAIQLTFGNALILIGGVGKSLLALVRGDFKEAGSIMKDTMADVSTNTAKAMSDFSGHTSFAIKQLRTMSAEELGAFKDTYSSVMEGLGNITEKNMATTATTFASKFKDMDQQSITIFKGTSDTMAMLLDGIVEGMDKTDMATVFCNNMEKMQRSGELTSDALQKDFSNAMKTISDNMSTGSTEIEHAASTLFDNFKSISTRGVSETADLVVADIQRMNSDTFNALTQMGGSWGEVFAGIKDNTSMSSEEMKNVLINNLSNMNISGSELMSALKADMDNHLNGIAESADTNLSQLPPEVQEAVSGMVNNAQGASAVKDAINNATSGTSTVVSTNLAGTSTAVNSEMSKAAQVASTGGQGVVNAIDNATKGADTKVDNNLKGAATSVDKNTKNLSKTAEQNFSKINKTADKNTKEMANKVKTNATNMYNGSKTSFSKAADAASKSTATMKNNVINNVAIMKNSAIRFWEEIRSTYSRTITGKIEITRTITEKVNKIVTVETENAEKASIASKDTINLTEKGSALRSLAVIKSADKIEANREDDRKAVNQVVKETKNITYNYSYTSPKESSISELRRKDRIQAQRIALSRR